MIIRRLFLRWLVIAAACAAALIQGPPAHGKANEVVNAFVDMTCYPPPPPEGEEPGIGPPPPCLLPVGLDPKFISPDPSGLAHIVVRDDDSATFTIDLDGLAPGLVVTAWVSYFFPPGAGPDPIFDPVEDPDDPTEVSRAVAAVSAPLAATSAGFSAGLGTDPNCFLYSNDSQARLKVNLDYNPLKAGQGPLRNGLVDVLQEDAWEGSGAEQGNCCPDGWPDPVLDAKPQPIGSSYLRIFDPVTGFPVLTADGWQELLRSPVPVAFIAIVAHTDETTHGINPGIPIFPIPGVSASVGDHFLLGLFDLRDLHLE